MLRRKNWLAAVASTGCLGAVAAGPVATGTPLWFADRIAYERNVAAVRTRMNAESLAKTWPDRRAMTLQQAIAYALEPAAPGAPTGVGQASKREFDGLTEREREVAALIAQGKSNREIAGVTVVGTRTVETYVTRMLNKVGFDSRVQITAWAMERGLSGTSQVPGQ
jgi:non-specific serine/threonine protein kinase